MGAPALYVLRDEEGLRARFDRSGAFGAAHVATGGVDDFRGYLEYSVCGDLAVDQWESLEGGVLVDSVTRTVAWHTAFWDLGSARIEYELLHRAYPGWTVKWAVEGMWSFADVLGIPRQDVRHHQDIGLQDPYHEKIGGPSCVMTIRESGAVRSIGLPYYLCSVADAVRVGPEIAMQLCEEEFETEDVEFGVCVDVDRRCVAWWTCMREEGVYPAAQALWPGWTFTCMGDDFERHNRFAGRRIAEFYSELQCDDPTMLANPVPCVRPEGLSLYR